MRGWNWIIGITALGLIGAAEWQHAAEQVHSIQVNIERPDDYVFVLEEEVVSEVSHFLGDTLNQRKAEINIALLEEIISEHPSVAHSEVYLDLAGVLHCNVRQRLPVLFVSSPPFEGYWDADGNQFFGSAENQMRCTELAQVTDSAFLFSAIAFVTAIQSDSLWQDQKPQLRMNHKGELTLFPANQGCQVVWGSPEVDSVRLARWHFFNREILPRVGPHYYQRVDLKYKDQIVALKK